MHVLEGSVGMLESTVQEFKDILKVESKPPSDSCDDDRIHGLQDKLCQLQDGTAAELDRLRSNVMELSQQLRELLKGHEELLYAFQTMSASQPATPVLSARQTRTEEVSGIQRDCAAVEVQITETLVSEMREELSKVRLAFEDSIRHDRSELEQLSQRVESIETRETSAEQLLVDLMQLVRDEKGARNRFMATIQAERRQVTEGLEATRQQHMEDMSEHRCLASRTSEMEARFEQLQRDVKHHGEELEQEFLSTKASLQHTSDSMKAQLTAAAERERLDSEKASSNATAEAIEALRQELRSEADAVRRCSRRSDELQASFATFKAQLPPVSNAHASAVKLVDTERQAVDRLDLTKDSSKWATRHVEDRQRLSPLLGSLRGVTTDHAPLVCPPFFGSKPG
jgi:DNA repair exonuclease SbcCD ATPase subunit